MRARARARIHVHVSVCVCVCKVMQERREGGKGGGCKCWSLMVKVHCGAQLRSFRAPPPSHHLTTTLPFPSSRRRIPCGCQISSTAQRDRALGLCDQKQKKRAPAYRSSLNSPDSGGVVDRLFISIFIKNKIGRGGRGRAEGGSDFSKKKGGGGRNDF